MALFHNALNCAAVATLFWGAIGLALACRLPLPRALWLPLAPALGWAVHSVAALSVFLVTGMTTTTVSILLALSIVAGGIAWWKRPGQIDMPNEDVHIPIWAYIAAAAFAAVVMLALLPKISAAGTALAGPVFDHAKVAMIDEMARIGVPAVNPFFGETDGFDHLAYYYLWHFSAAELVLLTGASGWEADAGMTGFTALSSLLLMMGFAVWLSSKASSAGWALIVAATTSIRPIVTHLLGVNVTTTIVGDPTGFGTWMFQIFWAPQHVASANSVVIAIFLLIRLAKSTSFYALAILGLLAAAAYESSVWVGGVTFTLAATAIAGLLLLKMDSRQRGQFMAHLAGAGVIAAAFAAPFLLDQLKASGLRGDGFPIAIVPYEVLGDQSPDWVRKLLDVPAYWSMLLFVEFAAFYPAGFLAAAWLRKDTLLTNERKKVTGLLAVLAFVGLAIGGLLKSTVAANNDLAWRSVLPSLLVLVALTGAGLGRYLGTIRPLAVAALMVPGAFALFDGAANLYESLAVQPRPAAARFLNSVAMWNAVRKHAGVGERIANNPQFLSEMTYWPINISWALLANRRSCYAGSDLALPFAPLTRQQRDEIEAKFSRVFSGEAKPDDLGELANRYNCAVVVLTPQDGAWTHDQFASDPHFKLVETDPNNWRIYRRQ